MNKITTITIRLPREDKDTLMQYASRIDTTALKKAMPEIAERFMKQTTTRRFCVR